MSADTQQKNHLSITKKEGISRAINKIASAGLALLISTGSAFADEEKSRLIEKIYQQAEVEQQLKEMHLNIQHSVRQYEGKIPSAALKKVDTALYERFDPGHFQQQFTEEMAKKISVTDAEQILKWFNSPQGRAVSEAEATANNDPNALEKYREQIDQRPPRQARIELIDELIDASNAENIGTQVTMGSTLGLVNLLNQVLPPEQQVDSLQLEKKLKSNEAGIRRELRRTLRYLFLYTYRTIPDHDLRAYIEFSNAPPMQRFSSTLTSSFAMLFK